MAREMSPRKARPRFNNQIQAQPPCLSFFIPQPAVVGHPSSYYYPEASLLGIPQEVRDRIWGYIFDDITSTLGKQWCTPRPVTVHDSLCLVCRQVFHEIARLWPLCMVTRHRLNAFPEPPYSPSRLLNFKSLCMQIPFNMSGTFFSGLATSLKHLAPVLRQLNLSFVGQDAYGTQTFLHGCGNMAIPMTQRLPIDGQGFAERHTLVNALMWLANLRTLSIRNANMPLMQSHLILHKPYLKKLHVECDPRSSLYMPWRAPNCGYGLFVPIMDDFPPVRELFISSNAALLSVNVVSKLTATLKKLTWLCPNARRSIGQIMTEVGRDTNIFLRGLSMSNHRLHTLRICIEEPITESSNDHGVLIGAFRYYLPRLASLRNLELHLCSRSPWFHTEILEALPPGLERLYVSHTLVPWDSLVSYIEQRIFDQEQSGKGKGHVQKFAAIVTQNELARRDFIPLKDCALTFVSYQYMGAGNVCMAIRECDDMDVSLALQEGERSSDDENMALLRLNGRLLDRARNRYLAELEPGAWIPPKKIPPLEPTSDDEQADIEAALKHLYKLSHGEVRSNNSMLQISGFQEDFDYFGHEEAAEAVFLCEQVMTREMLDEMEPRKYARRVPMGPKEHWLCA